MRARKKNITSILSKNYLWILAGALILIIILVFYYFHTSSVRSEIKTDDILSHVAKLINLPPEAPTIATVANLEPLRGQPFFVNAMVGDKVLIYSASHKAILYRPDTDKIIEVAPFSIDNSSSNGKTAR